MRELLSILLFISTIFAGAFLLIAVSSPIVYVAGHAVCKAQSNALGVKYSYGLLQGCVIELPNHQKIDIDHYIINAPTK